MSFTKRTSNCGIQELYGLGAAPEYIMLGFDLDDIPAIVLFSDTVRSSRGHKFEQFIIRNQLGDVVKCDPRKNPNSGNYIEAWLWSVNKAKLKNLLKKIA